MKRGTVGRAPAAVESICWIRRQPTALSRLGCQIKVRDELDGPIVRVPNA
jgi:hypothetical protein